jgi:hypothetical protein
VISQHGQPSLHLVAIRGFLVAQVAGEAQPATREPEPSANQTAAICHAPPLLQCTSVQLGATVHYVKAARSWRDFCDWPA